MIDELRFDSNGLVPAVVQDPSNGAVQMVGFMNRIALERTLDTGKVTFWSRSRQKLWVKGETSGNFLLFRDLFVNCEMNCLLVHAQPIGPTCHEGYQTCFYRRLSAGGAELEPASDRVKSPDEIYGSAR